MTRYRISWTEETWYRNWVEAESEDEARDKFAQGECFDDAEVFGIEVQDGVDVEEVA
jgi:hypothetical protein